jgi:hypothetical protein
MRPAGAHGLRPRCEGCGRCSGGLCRACGEGGRGEGGGRKRKELDQLLSKQVESIKGMIEENKAIDERKKSRRSTKQGRDGVLAGGERSRDVGWAMLQEAGRSRSQLARDQVKVALRPRRGPLSRPSSARSYGPGSAPEESYLPASLSSTSSSTPAFFSGTSSSFWARSLPRPEPCLRPCPHPGDGLEPLSPAFMDQVDVFLEQAKLEAFKASNEDFNGRSSVVD